MSEHRCLSCGRFTSVKPRHVVIGKGEGWTPFVSSCCVSEYESWVVKKTLLMSELRGRYYE